MAIINQRSLIGRDCFSLPLLSLNGCEEISKDERTQRPLHVTSFVIRKLKTETASLATDLLRHIRRLLSYH